MSKLYAAWRLTSLLVVFLLHTAVIVSIFSLSQPLPANFSENHFSLSIMLMFYAITFLSALLGQLILSQRPAHYQPIRCLFRMYFYLDRFDTFVSNNLCHMGHNTRYSWDIDAIH